MKWQARTFLGVMAATGAALLVYSLMNVASNDLLRFASLLTVALLGSKLKVRLPKLTGCLSVNLPFVLIAAAELSLFETLIIAGGCGVVQSLSSGERRTRFVQVLFNWSHMTVAAALAFTMFHPSFWSTTKSLAFGLAAVVFLLVNTIAVAGIIRLTEGGKIRKTWYSLVLWAFPNDVASAGMALMFTTAVTYVGWQIPLLLFPVMVIVYRSYKLFCARAESIATEPRAKAASA